MLFLTLHMVSHTRLLSSNGLRCIHIGLLPLFFDVHSIMTVLLHHTRAEGSNFVLVTIVFLYYMLQS